MTTLETIMGEKTPTLGTETPIKVGLAIMAAGVVWWGAVITTKLDSIQAMLTQVTSQQNKLAAELETLQARVVSLEAKGSPAVTELRKRFDDMELQFKLHVSKP